MKTLYRIGLAVLFAMTPTAHAAGAAPEKISFGATQMNVPLEGQFKKFSARIQYDPTNPTMSTASIDVDMASVDLGQEDFNSELRTRDWFDTRTYPKATFISSAIKPLAPNKLEVRGKLTVKGITTDITVPVTVTTEGPKRYFEGKLPLKRTLLNVGEGEWKDTSMVADEVEIRFRLATTAK